MSSASYQRFVNDYLNGERRDGAPIELLDELSPEEKTDAEAELSDGVPSKGGKIPS